MLIVIPVYEGDKGLAVKNLEWAIALDGKVPFRAVVTHESGFDASAVVQLAAEYFTGGVEEIQYYPWRGDRRWPVPQNWSWQQTARKMAGMEKPWLWWEADATPLRAGWLTDLQAEYKTAGKPFMGAWVTNNGTRPYMAGVAIYPADVAQFCTSAFTCQKVAFDVELGGYIKRTFAETKSIFHTVSPHTFKTPEDVALTIPKTAALFHKCKDGSLIEMLKSQPEQIKQVQKLVGNGLVKMSNSPGFLSRMTGFVQAMVRPPEKPAAPQPNPIVPKPNPPAATPVKSANGFLPGNVSAMRAYTVPYEMPQQVIRPDYIVGLKFERSHKTLDPEEYIRHSHRPTELPKVTLFSCCWSDNDDFLDRTARVLRYCQKQFRFGHTILFCHRQPAIALDDTEFIQIPALTGLDQWSILVNKIIPPYIETEFAMSVHEDGFPLAAELWDDRFLDYDYIGAPWQDGVVGNGGFNIESSRLLDLKLSLPFCELPPIAADYWVCRRHRERLEKEGIKFAPRWLALKFSTETNGNQWPSFGFHHRKYCPEKYHYGWSLIEASEK